MASLLIRSDKIIQLLLSLGFIWFFQHSYGGSCYAGTLIKGEEIDRILIYFIHPKIEFITPITQDEISDASTNQIFSGNKLLIKKFNEFLLKALENKSLSSTLKHSLSFKIIYSSSDGKREEFVVDKLGNYTFYDNDYLHGIGNPLHGKADKEDFKELVTLMELIIDNVDIRAIESRLMGYKLRYQ